MTVDRIDDLSIDDVGKANDALDLWADAQREANERRR